MTKPKNTQTAPALTMRLNMEDKTAHISITGDIGGDEESWDGGYCLRNWQADYTAAVNAGATSIILRINSPGGSLMEGFALADAIAESSLPVHCQVLGTCASAATLVAYACADVAVGAHSWIGVHEPSGGVFGTLKQCRDQLAMFESLRARVYETYSAVTGRTVAELEAELAEDKLYSAQQAVELGWATSVMQTEDDTPSEDPAEDAEPSTGDADNGENNPPEEEEEEKSSTDEPSGVVARILTWCGLRAQVRARSATMLAPKPAPAGQQLAAMRAALAAARAEAASARAEQQEQAARMQAAPAERVMAASLPASLPAPAPQLPSPMQLMAHGGPQAVINAYRNHKA